ncbi:MAG: MATE family efflux transporter [Lachnospiraceae bacterium]|nr:MATE family efflux transporter [Lachnospiraceae bacterium]
MENYIVHNQQNSSAVDSFRTDPVPKIIIRNSIPALIAMIMVMVYNIADTFFLGLTHNDLYVTAVSFATPLFMIFMSLGTLFGVGGTSVISRALGAGRKDYARSVSSFCMWSCVAVGAVFMAILWVFLDRITVMLGASEESMGLTRDYLRIAIGCGVFSMISNCFSSIVRTEGEAMKAMTGTLIGNLINMVLDPIFILVFKWGVAGAAIATVIGNAIAAGYYILYFIRGKSTLSISPKYFSMKEGILTGVLSVGISASLANLLVSVSSIVVNSQLGHYPNGDMLVAGYGVTAKIIMIVTLIGIGIGSGVQPFLGYCYGAKEKLRLEQGIRFSAGFGLVLCFIVSALCFIFAKPVVRVFLTDMTALDSGVHFTRILMTTAWLIGAFAICQNTLQAIGAATSALLASVFRQGVIFIPAVFIMKAIMGIDGLIWAQPVADVLSLIIVIIMLKSKIDKTDFTKAKTEDD